MDSFSIFLFAGVEHVFSPGQGGSLAAIPREKDESAQLTASAAGVQARGMLAQGWSYAVRINVPAVELAVQDVSI